MVEREGSYRRIKGRTRWHSSRVSGTFSQSCLEGARHTDGICIRSSEKLQTTRQHPSFPSMVSLVPRDGSSWANRHPNPRRTRMAVTVV